MARCSGYRIACPKLVTRPWGPDGAFDADDQPCEATVLVTLDGEKSTGEQWIKDYEPECSHEYDELSPGEQERATLDAVEAATDHAMDGADYARDHDGRV